MPPSSTMRAMFLRSSSISTAPRLTGSDGALTVASVCVWARHGLLDFRWTLSTAARRIIALLLRLCGAGTAPGADGIHRRATLLWSYCRSKASSNCLNWQRFCSPGGEGRRSAQVCCNAAEVATGSCRCQRRVHRGSCPARHGGGAAACRCDDSAGCSGSIIADHMPIWPAACPRARRNGRPIRRPIRRCMTCRRRARRRAQRRGAEEARSRPGRGARARKRTPRPSLLPGAQPMIKGRPAEFSGAAVRGS